MGCVGQEEGTWLGVVVVEEALVGECLGLDLVVWILCCYCFLWWGVEAPRLVVPLFRVLFLFFSLFFCLFLFFLLLCRCIVFSFVFLVVFGVGSGGKPTWPHCLD